MWAHAQDALLVAVGVVLAALGAKFKESFKKLLDFVGRHLFDWLVGRDLFTRRAVRAYVHRLYDEHRQFHVSFQPGSSSEPMDMRQVYVRLGLATGVPGLPRPSGSAGGRTASASLADKDRTVVLGAPGAGKTMLLRHTVLTWVLARHRPDAPARRTWYGRRRPPRADVRDLTGIPVLLPLGRLDPGVGLREQIVSHLAGLGFRNAGRWLDRVLDGGGAALYFDGLDEVTTAHRADIVQMLRTFLGEHRSCRAVITCRVAVYEGEFNEDFGAPLHVEPFDDTQIGRFLRGYPWPDDLEPDTADQLLGVLRDTPQLMALVTNPLLLTMVAYLHSTVYAGTNEQLPHTRADFYKEVVGALLDDRRRTRHPRPVKLAALQRIALAAQDVPSSAHDRLALEEKEVLRHIEAALVDQRREATSEKALEVLTEIVERTGLLLRIDGGVRYQFAHLTLQEYLTARALAGDPAALLGRYARDPAAWRETVRLWCGVEVRDCTEVVREVFRQDPLLAFQCLADAHQVERELSERVIEAAMRLLNEDLGDGSFRQVTTAFGVVAADRREPGPRVLRLLESAARSPVDHPTRQRAAAFALAATHMPRAATTLTTLLVLPGIGEAAVEALASMGNLAVPALRAFPLDQYQGYRATLPFRALWLIRTPKAARVLAEFLPRSFHRNPDIDASRTCAFYLADLLRDTEIERTLDAGTLATVLDDDAPSDPPLARRNWHIRRPSDFRWVWQPFAAGKDSALISLVALIAWWLARNEGFNVPPGVRLDPRITAPLALYAASEDQKYLVAPRISLHDFAATSDEFFGRERVRDFVKKINVTQPPYRYHTPTWGELFFREIAMLIHDDTLEGYGDLLHETRDLWIMSLRSVGATPAHTNFLAQLPPHICLKLAMVGEHTVQQLAEAWSQKLDVNTFYVRYGPQVRLLQKSRFRTSERDLADADLLPFLKFSLSRPEFRTWPSPPPPPPSA